MLLVAANWSRRCPHRTNAGPNILPVGARVDYKPPYRKGRLRSVCEVVTWDVISTGTVECRWCCYIP